MHLRIGSDDRAQQRLGALYVDGEIVVNKEDHHLAVLAPRASFQSQEFVHHAFIAAKAYGISEKAGYRAKLAAIRTASAGLHRNNPEGRPSATDAPQYWS